MQIKKHDNKEAKLVAQSLPGVSPLKRISNVASLIVGLLLFANSAVVPALARQESTLPSPQENSGLSTYIPETGLAVKASIKPPSILAQVNVLLKMSSADFWNTRRKFRSDYSSAIDWSTDFCGITGFEKVVPDKGLHFNFTAACVRHDFGYANYRKLNKFNKETKEYVDGIFLLDMKAHCDGRGLVFRVHCYDTALVYYGFVKGYSGGL